MATVDVERLGGLAGFGLPGSRLRSRGRIDTDRLTAADRTCLEALFARRGPSPEGPADAFCYRITRTVAGQVVSIEAAEHEVPAPVRDCVQDGLD